MYLTDMYLMKNGVMQKRVGSNRLTEPAHFDRYVMTWQRYSRKYGISYREMQNNYCSRFTFLFNKHLTRKDN